jgi:hypothetical protein
MFLKNPNIDIQNKQIEYDLKMALFDSMEEFIEVRTISDRGETRVEMEIIVGLKREIKC